MAGEADFALSSLAQRLSWVFAAVQSTWNSAAEAPAVFVLQVRAQSCAACRSCPARCKVQGQKRGLGED